MSEIIQVDGVDTSLYGQRLHWSEIEKRYPDHYIHYSDPTPVEDDTFCLDNSTVTIYGACTFNNEEGRAFYKHLKKQGIKVGIGCTRVDNAEGIGVLWLS